MKQLKTGAPTKDAPAKAAVHVQAILEIAKAEGRDPVVFLERFGVSKKVSRGRNKFNEFPRHYAHKVRPYVEGESASYSVS